jgi:hypothetical protein
MLLARHRLIAAVACSLTIASSVLAVGAPAGASSRTAMFCSDVTGATTVPSPTLPLNDSLKAIAKAVKLLPRDVTALHKEHVKLLAASATAPNATTRSLLRDAAANVSDEGAALNDVISQEINVAFDPSSNAVMSLARKLIVATSSAASANTYLLVERTQGPKSCA